MNFNKKVKATIVRIEGKGQVTCSFGHKVGESLRDLLGLSK